MNITVEFWLGLIGAIGVILTLQWTISRAAREDSRKRHDVHDRRSQELADSIARLDGDLDGMRDRLLAEVKENERGLEGLRAELHRDYVQARQISDWQTQVQADQRRTFERMEKLAERLENFIGRIESYMGSRP